MIDTAATQVPSVASTGAAMHRTPVTVSSWSNPMPSWRTLASSLRRDGEVTVFGVRA